MARGEVSPLSSLRAKPQELRVSVLRGRLGREERARSNADEGRPAGTSKEADDSDVDLTRMVEGLSSQVDAVLAERPLAPRQPFRKNKHEPSHSGAPRPVVSGNRSPQLASYESCTATPFGSSHPSAWDTEEGGVRPSTLRNRLVKTMEASLAENISKYAEYSRNTTPLIFAEKLINKLRRVSGQSNLVVVGQSFDEEVIGENTRKILLEGLGTSSGLSRRSLLRGRDGLETPQGLQINLSQWEEALAYSAAPSPGGRFAKRAGASLAENSGPVTPGGPGGPLGKTAQTGASPVGRFSNSKMAASASPGGRGLEGFQAARFGGSGKFLSGDLMSDSPMGSPGGRRLGHRGRVVSMLSRAAAMSVQLTHAISGSNSNRELSPDSPADSPCGRKGSPTPVPYEDEATAEHIFELLFAGTEAVVRPVNEVSEIVGKAMLYKPQFQLTEVKGQKAPDAKGQDHTAAESVGAKAADLTAADKRARTMRAQLLVIVGGQVAVFFVEAITFMVQHVFWGSGDFLCVVREGETNSVSTANVTVLAFLLSAHVVRALLCWIVVLISVGILPNWASYSLHKRSSVLEVAAEAAIWTTLITMTVLTIEEDLHKCLEYEHHAFLFSVYTRLHSALHLLRTIMAAHACFVLRLEARRLMQIAVSGNKRRFVDEDFDLDLTYIADRLIAMALPCVAGAAYRNDIRQVSHFLTSRHYGSFKIFNLCEAFEEFGNGNYAARFFHQQVVRITMRDHNICSLVALVSFCRQATAFLNLDPSNVVVVHCRGGKGRTGTFCSSLLLWSDFCTTALGALATFATRRTDLTRSSLGKTVMQGVASPSQVRYVHYIEAIKRLNFDYVSRRQTRITRVVVRGVPRKDLGGVLVTFIIETSAVIIYDHAKEQGLTACYEGEGNEDGGGGSTYSFEVPYVPVGNDCALRFFFFDRNVSWYCVKRRNCELSKGGQVMNYRTLEDGEVWGKQLMFVQWHTSFHDTPKTTYSRSQVDGVYTKPFRQFAEDFSVEVHAQGIHIDEAEKHRTVAANGGASPDHTASFLDDTERNRSECDIASEQSWQSASEPASRAQGVWDKVSPAASKADTKKSREIASNVRGKRLRSSPIGKRSLPSPVPTDEFFSWRNHKDRFSDCQQLSEIFRLAGAVEMVFAKGDRVRGVETDTGDRSLMLIVSGHVAVFPDSRRTWANMPYFNPGLYRLVMHRGDGEMLGELDFLLGVWPETPLVVCTSDSLSLLKLPFAADVETLEPPLMEDQIGEEKSLLLYEMMARGLTMRSVRLDWIIANAQADLVKRDQVGSNEAVIDKRLAALRMDFRIALSQECFMKQSCLIRYGANLSKSCCWFKGHQSQIYVFSEQVFLTLNSGRVAQFQVKSIHSVEAVGSQVTIFVSEFADDFDMSSKGSTGSGDREFEERARGYHQSRRASLVDIFDFSSFDKGAGPAGGSRARRVSLKSNSPLTEAPDGSPSFGKAAAAGSRTLPPSLAPNRGRRPSLAPDGLDSFSSSTKPDGVAHSRARRGSLADGLEAVGLGIEAFQSFGKAKLTEPDWKQTKKDLESRCYETTRLEFFDCGSALAARDIIRKQCASHDHTPKESTTNMAINANPSAVPLAARRRSQPRQNPGSWNSQATGAVGTPVGGAGDKSLRSPLSATRHLRNGDTQATLVSCNSSHSFDSDMPGPENIEDVLGTCTQVDFHKGDVILQEGSCDRALYVVVQGFALACHADGHVLVRKGPGEVFGEISMYATSNRGASCSVVAGSPVTGIKVLSLDAIKRSGAGNPLQMARLHRFIARSLAVRAQSQVRRESVFEY